MKAIPVCHDGESMKPCEAGLATHIRIKIPGPSPELCLPVMQPISATRAGTHYWSWNGDTEKPTLRPSIKTTGTDDSGNPYVCHTWVNDGMAQFLSDSTHELSGQTHELLPV